MQSLPLLRDIIDPGVFRILQRCIFAEVVLMFVANLVSVIVGNFLIDIKINLVFGFITFLATAFHLYYVVKVRPIRFVDSVFVLNLFVLMEFLRFTTFSDRLLQLQLHLKFPNQII